MSSQGDVSQPKRDDDDESTPGEEVATSGERTNADLLRENEALRKALRKKDEELRREMMEKLDSLWPRLDVSLSALSESPLTFSNPFETVGNFDEVLRNIIAIVERSTRVDDVHRNISSVGDLPATSTSGVDRKKEAGVDRKKEACRQAECVVAPPRHGKSLLLDKLAKHFNANETLHAISLTYNGISATHFSCTDDNVSGLSLRVLYRLSRTKLGEQSFVAFVEKMQWKPQFELTWPLLHALLVEKNVLRANRGVVLLVDEATHAKDRQILGHALKIFACHDSDRNTVVLTGFRHAAVNDFFSASGIPVGRSPFTLQCSARDTIALGKRLRAIGPFDEELWQISKSVPGLIGFFLEDAITRSTKDPPRAPPWLRDVLTKSSVNEKRCVERLLCMLMSSRKFADDADVSKLIDDFNLERPDGVLCLAPVFYAIFPKAQTLMTVDQSTRTLEAQTDLGKAIYSAITAACAPADRPRGSGDAFEKFTAYAMRARLLSNTGSMTLRDFLAGAHLWRLQNASDDDSPTAARTTTYLAVMSSRHALESFFTKTLYDVFPVAIPNAYSFSVTGKKEGLNSTTVTALLAMVFRQNVTKQQDLNLFRASTATGTQLSICKRFIEAMLKIANEEGRPDKKSGRLRQQTAAAKADDEAISTTQPTGEVLEVKFEPDGSNRDITFQMDASISIGALCDAIAEATKFVDKDAFLRVLLEFSSVASNYFEETFDAATECAANLTVPPGSPVDEGIDVDVRTTHNWKDLGVVSSSGGGRESLVNSRDEVYLQRKLQQGCGPIDLEATQNPRQDNFSDWLNAAGQAVALATRNCPAIDVWARLRFQDETEDPIAAAKPIAVAAEPIAVALQAKDRRQMSVSEWQAMVTSIEQECTHPPSTQQPTDSKKRKDKASPFSTADSKLRVIIIAGRTEVRLRLKGTTPASATTPSPSRVEQPNI